MSRALVRLATVVALIASALLLPTTGSTPADTASAADLSYFDPANIISDAVFFDSLSTDTASVQAFLNLKGAKCAAGPAPCLKDYSQATADQQGDAYCATYRGAPNGESAASIIVKVGQACRINPRVLLVLLQKEQSLVTGSNRPTSAYTNATGFACPDTAPCNPAFSGFASQVYFAARQFQRYAAGAAGSYRAGVSNKVYFHPDLARCGSTQVVIQNKATAGLYSYTPYQPNAAALRAGYGTGDDCSSYGNRNFWNYFTDWFGSTQSTGGSAIYSAYQASGGASGPLGAVATTFLCGYRDGGCFQTFAGGAIYWSPGSGAHVLTGSIYINWSARGWEQSTLGYPTTDTACGLRAGGCYQYFQGGTMYWTPGTGAVIVRGEIRDVWGQTGWENGWLGYPISDELCGLGAGGCVSHFENGSIFTSPATGPRVLNTTFRNKYQAMGWNSSVLGYPTSSTTCGLRDSGCYQLFQGGRLYWSPATGAVAEFGPIGDVYAATGNESGWLGYPTADVQCVLSKGGCFSHYQYGSIFSSPATGPHVIDSTMRAKYQALGWDGSVLGYPTSNTTCGLPANGCYQLFQGGQLYWSPATGASYTSDDIGALYSSAGGPGSWLGYPVTDQLCVLSQGGCVNHFQGGSVFWSPGTGAHTVGWPIRDGYWSQGWDSGVWGFPTGEAQQVPGGISQRFQGGTVTWNATTGAFTLR